MDIFVLGHVGRFSYQKNHEFLIDVFKSVYETNKNIRLLVIGQGELEDRIHERICRYGLEDVVCHIRSTPAVNEYMQAMDAFLFPSRYEGLGIVAVEAQVAGLPIIVSESIPYDIHLTDLVHVRTINSGVKIWVDTVHEIMQQVVERKKYAEEVKNSGYCIEDSARELEKIYELS